MKNKIIYKIIGAIFFITSVIATPARADFEAGLQYYSKHDFEKAYVEFLDAAKSGYCPAQYNLGVMFSRGEFVKKNILQGYAWFALAAQEKQYSDKGMHTKIYVQLSDVDKKKADAAYAELFNQFGGDAIEKAMTPVLSNFNAMAKKIRPIKKVIPIFPAAMKDKLDDGGDTVPFSSALPVSRQSRLGITGQFDVTQPLLSDTLPGIDSDEAGSDAIGQLRDSFQTLIADFPEIVLHEGQSGIVDLSFTVDKDGTTGDYQIYFSSTDAFTKSALEAARHMRYEPVQVDGKAVAVNGVKYRFVFKKNADGFNLDDVAKTKNALKEKAISGDVSDKVAYAYFLDILPAFTGDEPTVDPLENPNRWYLEAAKAGSATASFFLGQNFLNGNMCVPDPDKAMRWLHKAAAQNLADAQYLLAQELLSGARVTKNEEQAMYWLEKAAAGKATGNVAAKLRLALILATHPDPARRNGTLAYEYLKSIDRSYLDQQSYFQTAAAVSAEMGDFSAAEKWQQKALDDAHYFELPEQAVKTQLDAYRNKQARRETL